MDDAEMEEFFSEDDINQIEILKDSPLDKTEPATDPPPIVLSDEQQSVIRLCERGESLFFTGSAGALYSVEQTS
ncbi:hypothetical protein CPB86DRAFT_784311 [Serendipita vermifera]|nr:hypothetical protein CPB86DRAFT_784311 [Serendipita vermifera]